MFRAREAVAGGVPISEIRFSFFEQSGGSRPDAPAAAAGVEALAPGVTSELFNF
jgi:hypothetical protein